MSTPIDKLHITSLGGLEEVGKNMMVIEYKQEIIIIDCGLKFPKIDTPGVDFVINDFSYIKNNQKKLKGLIITHGHLDHIGAIPELLKIIDIKIYCTKFTQLLIEKVFNNYPNLSKPKYHFYTPNKHFSIGSFDIEGIPVNHSIIEACSFAITTPIGTIIHTGDWRIDSESNNNEQIDINKFKSYGEKGVLALFSDSTNAVKKGYNLSERSVSENLEDVFLTFKGRIIIATFSTQINRIKEVIHLSKLFNKKIFVSGRSMINIIEASMNLNILEESNLFIKPKDIKKIKPENTVILTTGTQGEEKAGLLLMAKGTHRFITLNKKDLIILSSSFIPGNEYPINNLLNLLYKKELNIITNKDKDIHATGHASIEELKSLINWVKPKYFIPIHGESIQLVNHKKIAIEEGIDEKNIFLISNGHKLEVGKKESKITDKIKLKSVYKEGKKTQILNNELFDERQALNQNGVIFLFIHISKLSVKDVEIQSKGFIDKNNGNKVTSFIKDLVINKANRSIDKIGEVDNKFEIGLKKEVRKYLRKELDKNPAIFLKVHYS